MQCFVSVFIILCYVREGVVRSRKMCVARVSFCTLACTPGKKCMGVAVCLFRKACVSLCSWKDILKECKDVIFTCGVFV